MVIELAALHKEARKAIALQRRVPVVQVCGGRRQAKAAVVPGRLLRSRTRTEPFCGGPSRPYLSTIIGPGVMRVARYAVTMGQSSDGL